MWVNENTGYLMVDTAVTQDQEIDAAEDKVVTLAHLDAGTCNERIDTIVVSSVAVGQSYTDTFAYSLVNGKYVLDSVTRS